MEIKSEYNPADYPIGVVIARFQTHKLHEGHIKLLDFVFSRHKKVIIFLGVAPKQNSRTNPLDFATRKAMIQEAYPKAVVLAQNDNRSDTKWSNILDQQIKVPFGNIPALLYGSRDSFIPHYNGKYPTVEVITDTFYSGTQARLEASREILSSEDFRAGIIHSTFAQFPVTYPTVDVVAYNDDNKILLAKKPNEDLYRFVGGFVDRTDANWEQAAKREFSEETGGCEIGELRYVCSAQIDDWRYDKSESGIMSTLFIGKFMFGRPEPADDIAVLEWKRIEEINVERDIMPEHRELMTKLLTYLGY